MTGNIDTGGVLQAIEIRPGVFRPDWSTITTPGARRALAGRMAARAGLLSRWSHRLDDAEDRVWRTILRLYAEHGRAPANNDIAAGAHVAVGELGGLLRHLQSRDLIGLDGESERVRLAYPFTEASTGHRIQLGGRTLNALCAIDALGTPSMYRADVHISSPCGHCGRSIHVTTAREGRALDSVEPPRPVVWYDFAYDGCAHSSICPSIVFFCSDEHLESWQASQKNPRDGVRLTMEEALEVGRAIFGPVLVDATAG